MAYNEFLGTFDTDEEMNQDRWEELENLQAGLDNSIARLPEFGEDDND